MRLSVIFSTYNNPEWLEKTIWGWANQTHKDFEIIIADDGSTDETRQKIEDLNKEFNLDIVHLWQQDKGFQKTKILNKAISTTDSDYIVFTDGDCIPRNDFLEVHMINAEKGYFLSGGYFKLSKETSLHITCESVNNGEAFDTNWLRKHGLEWTYKSLKLTSKGWFEQALNRYTPAGATWNGHNASGWKEDILAVNGFDERMQYGGEDRELGERLFYNGIKSKQIRYSAIVLHLDHSRGYNTKESIEKNLAIRKNTKSNKITWTEYGVTKGKPSDE